MTQSSDVSIVPPAPKTVGGRAPGRRGLLAAVAALAGAGLARIFSSPTADAGHSSADGLFHLGQNNTNGTGATTQLSGAGGGTEGALKVTNSSGRGIVGEATAGNYHGVAGRGAGSAAGVHGEHAGGGPGVHGYSLFGHGVRGESNAHYGVHGYSNTHYGVHAESAGLHALYARKSSTNGYAGIFDGGNGVLIAGALSVTGNKSAVVPHPDGTLRRFYCTESPESWFEDFGSSQLSSGQATVALEPIFRELIRTESYQVQITPEGDCRGLYVTNKTATGFTVRELQGGTASVAFTYRVVAKRKDIAAPRLEVVPIPTDPDGKPLFVVGSSTPGNTATVPPANSTSTPQTPQPTATPAGTSLTSPGPSPSPASTPPSPAASPATPTLTSTPQN